MFSNPILTLYLRILLPFVFILFCAQLNGQELKILALERIDSLNNELRNAKNDTARLQFVKLLQYAWYGVNNDSGIRVSRYGAELAIKLNDKLHEAFFLRRVGVFYYQKYDYGLALEYYFKALSASEASGSKEDIAWCYNNIANVYVDKYEVTRAEVDLDKSVEFAEKAVEIMSTLENKNPLASGYSNLGSKLMLKRKYKEAQKMFLKAIDMFVKIGDLNGELMCYENLGGAFLAEGEEGNDFALFSNALNYYEKIIRLAGPGAMDSRYARVITQVSRIHIRMGFLDKAKEYLTRALDIATSINDKELLRNVYTNMVDYHEQKGDFKIAFSYQKKLNAVRDSMLSLESLRNMNQMQAMFNNEKQQKEIEEQKKLQRLNELELKRKNLIIFSTIAVTILLSLLAALLVNRNLIRKRANKQLRDAFNTIAVQNKNITDSITYAKRIQDTFVSNEDKLRSVMPNASILYKPLHIISGDFCWSAECGGKKIVVVADCTGHGVPGAFMSMIGNTVLKETVLEKKITDPASVLQSLHEGVVSALNQKNADLGSQSDGMDVSVFTMDPSSKKITFAGANHSMIIANGESVTLVEGDYFSVGGIFSSKGVSFATKEFALEKGKTFYMFTDGLTDQFGGPEDKKFSYSRLESIIKERSKDSPELQRNSIEDAFVKWQGAGRQTDDVLLVIFNT